MTRPFPRVADRIRDYWHIVLAVAIGMTTVAVVVTLFILQAHSYSATVNARDDEIARLAVNYAKLRDQDYSLQIAPAAPSLAQVETPTAGPAGLPIPRAFTAAFPNGYFTCTDHLGDGNYVCTVSKTGPTTTTTGPAHR
jgi:hypothetical protein